MDAEDWNKRYAAADLVWSRGPNQFVAELAGPPVGAGRALDIAAGEGRNAIWFAEQGWQVTATDFSAVAVQRIQELAAGRLERPELLRAEVGDATRLSTPEAYDLVLFSYLQLPEPSWAQALAAGIAACAPGGRVLIVMHARQNLIRGYGGPQDGSVLHDPDHVVDAVTRMAAEGIGISVEYAGLRERAVDTDDGPRIALDTVVILRRSEAVGS